MQEMATSRTPGRRSRGHSGSEATSPQDPYSEIELYLRKAEEEISAVFGENEERSASQDHHPRPRTPARPPLADGQGSPSKIRKVYSGAEKTETCLTRRQVSSIPYPRRRIPFTRKTRRVSAPTLPIAHACSGSSSPPPWHPRTDPLFQQWSRGLLKDFHSLVEEEIRTLRGSKSPPDTTLQYHWQHLLSDSGKLRESERLVNAYTTACQAGECAATKVAGEPCQKSLCGHDNEAVLQPLSQASLIIAQEMGATQSAGRGDTWAGERSAAFKTYTLPRGHRSVSLSGAGAITYRDSSGHPDDSDISCQLLRVNPRFSRSHSLDEGTGLSPWALQHLAVIDDTSASPPPTPADESSRASQSTLSTVTEPQTIPTTPRDPLSFTELSSPAVHYGKTRKTGYTEKDNEHFRPHAVECDQGNYSTGGLTNGWDDHPTLTFPATCTHSTNSTDSIKLHRVSESFLNSNGSSAFTPADLRKGVSEPWEWADQEGACSLTDRPCDPNSCTRCYAKMMSVSEEKFKCEDVMNQKETTVASPTGCKLGRGVPEIEGMGEAVCSQYKDSVSVCVTPPELLNVTYSEELYPREIPTEAEIPGERLSCNREWSVVGRKSEPSLLSVMGLPGQLDGRRHTLPVPRAFGSLSFLSVPVPTFNTSSWETLPPADELEVELEEKPITGSVVRPTSPAVSATSSRSLNSSLSSLSLSVHPDHSECDSWPSSPMAQPYLTPDVFFDPTAMAVPFKPDDFSLKGWPYEDDSIFMPRGRREADVVLDSGIESHQAKMKVTKNIQSPEPIMGMLHTSPEGYQGRGDIIFSVSIPEDHRKDRHKSNLSFSSTNESSDISTICDKSESQVSDLRDEDTMANVTRNEAADAHPESLCPRLASISLQDGEDKCDLEKKMIGCRDTKDSGVTDLSSSVEGSAAVYWHRNQTRERLEGDLLRPPARYRSFSLDETTSALHNQNIKLVNSATQSHRPEALVDFLKAVESRIRSGSVDQSPPDAPLPCFPPSPTSPRELSFCPAVVLDACTQTTPTPPATPPPASRASSVTWLSDCGCDDMASMEPCASSLALSATEDDYGEDDDDDDDDWSAGVSLSWSSPPPTPASLPRDDSSLSLSESLDTLDLNGESGIGTVSTRPSVSPYPQAALLDLSGSNLSSEDTGLENSFERQLRRYIPHHRGGREGEHGGHYRRRRPRPRHHEQWVRREDQTTQTDPEPPAPAHALEDDSNDSLRESRETLDPRGSRAVRHTHSEPRLDAHMTPIVSVLRGVCSETTITPTYASRTHFTPSAPTLPTLTEDKPPIAPSRPRHLSLSSPPTQTPAGTACSAPTLETRAHHTPATTPSEESSGETSALTTRAQSSKEIAELEALEACKWLRAAGFPQYAQMYEELQFPLDLVCVERDHTFLDGDSLQALFRRLRALNRCAKIRLDSARKNKVEESDDEEQQCALSGNWKFQRHSRRWSRIVHDRSPSTGGEGKVCEPRGLELPDDPLLGQFKRSGSERLRDGAKALLKRMESLKNKKKKRQNRDGVIISGPKVLDEAHMEARVAELACVDISPDASPELSTRSITTAPGRSSPTLPKDIPHTTRGEDSSSIASDHSQTSTPMFRSRRRRKNNWRTGGSNQGGREGVGGAYSDSECSPPTWRHYLTNANSNKMMTVGQTTSVCLEKRTNKGGTGRQSRASHLRHTGSLTYGKDSQVARETFLATIRSGVEKYVENISPLPSPEGERHSVYDNVPLIICNKSYHDYQPEVMDSEASAPEGSGSSECTVESRDSPLPSTHDDEENDEPCQRRITVDRWHSFNRKSFTSSSRYLGTQLNGFSAGQMLHLRKRALLRLTALMERYCPSNRSGWNWELPKFMRKIKTPDYRDRQVFGVPLLVITQRTGQPLPPGIQAALQYLRATSLDQVGIFRKPGVRSRIQKLREYHESGEDIQYSSFGTCDIADMVKTYFRELPEVLLTNKLSEMFIAIFQYLPAEHRLEALQCAVLLLPDENREVLMALLIFLSDVAANSHLNQMHASNLAVCLAPSLFHLNVGGSGSSPLRRRAAGTPEQRDLHENKAAHQCLTLMIQQVSHIQCVPVEMLSNCRFTYLEQSQPVCLEDLGVMGSPGANSMEGDWASYMNACITSLLKEARDRSRGWVHMNCADSNVEILYRKVGDGHPLRLWRATTEVEAPPSELLNRVIRERHLWDDSLLKWRVVCRLDRQAEVFQYMCNSMTPRPPVDYCVLRCWRSDLARGSCVVVETSVEHADAPVLVGGVRGIVLASRHLIQPCGSGKSRITHISRLDMRGRTPEWYNKVYGPATAMHLTRIRESFQHHAIGPESKV